MPPERRDGSSRRGASAVVLCLALGARVATAEPPATAPSKPEVQTRESQVAMTPSQALDRLKAGNARFVAKLIVVLGHTSCGAVKGAIDGVQLGNLTGLLAKIHPAVEAAHCSDSKDAGCVTKVAEENVRQSIRAIRERSPYVAKYLDDGTVALVGGMYDVATGRVTFLEH